MSAPAPSTPSCRRADRIHLLSTLLNNTSCANPVSNIDPLDPEGHGELRSYYYLATLLTTGAHRHNCAVTAILLQGVVKCIIADTGDTKRRPTDDSAHAHAVEVHSIVEGQRDLQDLGSAPSDPVAVDFEEHAADVLHCLRTFHHAAEAMVDSPDAPSPYWPFLRFIVRRCHLKIAERMSNGTKIWKVHPMVVLRDWDPGTHVFPKQEFAMRHQVLQAILSLYGVPPLPGRAGGDRTQYAFSHENAKSWAQVACAIYEILEKRLFTPYFDETMSLKNMPRASMDVDSIAFVADYLDSFAVMLDLPPMKAILTHSSFTSRLELLAVGSVEGIPQDGTKPPVAFDDQPESKEERETAGEHVFRYLRAVVSWVTATLHLVQHEIFRSDIPIEVYHIHIPSENDTGLSALDSIHEDVLGKLSGAGDVTAGAYLDSQLQVLRKAKVRGHIHAEAALMGILLDGGHSNLISGTRPIFRYRGMDLGNVADIIQQGHIAIGGTHNCCFCCWSLAQALSEQTGCTFMLTGTHGIVRSWYPPRIGIPDTFYGLDATLLDVFCQKCENSIPVQDTKVAKERRLGLRWMHWRCSLFG